MTKATFNSGYYPAGAANDPQAPWNEPSKEEIRVKVEITLSMVLESTVEVEKGQRPDWLELQDLWKEQHPKTEWMPKGETIECEDIYVQRR